MNPPKTAAARSSENLDFSQPDQVNDAVFNEILWSMLKPGQPYPTVHSTAPMHAMTISR
jgi:hypothetical protein